MPQVRPAVTASDNDPLALRDRVQNRQPRIGKVGLNLSEHLPHALPSARGFGSPWQSSLLPRRGRLD
jgi:hypothetical protein